MVYVIVVPSISLFHLPTSIHTTQAVISPKTFPKTFFLFTPLLASVVVGTINPRSIIQLTRYILRHKARNIKVIEAEADEVDVSHHDNPYTLLLSDFC